MFYEGLKKDLIYHIIAGIIFSIILFIIIFLSKYERSLNETINKLELMRGNVLKMESTVKDMVKVMRQIDAGLPSDYYSKSHREIILSAIGDIKAAIRRAEVTLIDFEKKEGEVLLPVIIKFPVKNYTTMTKNIGYLQSLRFPHFQINYITVTVPEGEGELRTVCEIKGSLKMPVKKLKNTL